MGLACGVAFEHADAKRLKFRNDLLPDYPQGFGSVAGHQDRLFLRQEVAEEIGDCVCLPGAGRPLNFNGPVAFEPSRNFQLFGIRFFA